MREIKFRAWLKEQDGDEWYGDGMVYFGFKEGKREAGFYLHNDRADLLKNAPIMQFTGLKDKNGKEIYEGDIVSGSGREPNYIVEFGDGCFRGNEINGWDVMVNHFPLSRSVTISEEVIGNIYENGDLL